MFPENIAGNFDRVMEIAFSELPMDEKMRLFDEFDEILVTDFVKNRKFYVKNCFLPIAGFEDYLINPFSDVISSKGDFIRLLSQNIDGSGYLMVFLFRDGKRYMQKVHRLVANTFLQNTEHKPQVNHIDGDKENNRLDNLEYCTQAENIQHAYRTGLYSKRGRLTEDELNQIVDMINACVIYRDIANRFDVSEQTISDIAYGRRHKKVYDNIKKPEKRSKTHKIKVRCIETGKIYNSQAEAALDLNINRCHISMHLKGKCSQAKGFHFERIKEGSF